SLITPFDCAELFVLLVLRPLGSTPFPYTTLFRSAWHCHSSYCAPPIRSRPRRFRRWPRASATCWQPWAPSPSDCCAISAATGIRSEEHTSELQSRENLVCRLLLEKKKNDQFS